MTNLILVALLGASTAAFYGLLATWTALGRGHWFVRTAVLAATIGMFLSVPAFDLAIVFASEALTIAMPLGIWRVVRSARGGVALSNPSGGEESDHELARASHRFSLIDLFLLTIVAAGIACLGVYLPAEHRAFWLDYVGIGAGAGAAALAAVWAGLGRRWAWLRWGVLLAIAASVSLAMRAIQAPEEISEVLFGGDTFFDVRKPPNWFAAAAIGGSSLLIACCLLLLRSVGWLPVRSQPASSTARQDGSSPVNWKRRMKQGLVAAAIAASLTVPFKGFVEILFPPAAPTLPLPAPNGYDLLAALGHKLEQASLFDIEEPSADQLREFVAANRDRLHAARAALNLPHVVPAGYDDQNNLAVEQFSDLRQLSRAFVAAGDLARLDGRPNDSARCYLDAVRLARVIAQGGLLVHMLLGNAVEGHGRSRLSEIRTLLSPQATREALTELERLDDERDAVDEVLEREDIWQRRVNGWPGRLSCRAQSDWLQGARDSSQVAISNTRLLIYDLAIRLYRQERGRPPKSLAELVPQYLSRVRDDPYSGRPPRYEATETSYRLYSIGPDLDDDGGRPIAGGLNYGDGDFVLEEE